MDPRVTTTPEGLQKQFQLSTEMYTAMSESTGISARAEQLSKRLKGSQPDLEALVHSLHTTAAHASQVYNILQGTDGAPTSQAESAAQEVFSSYQGGQPRNGRPYEQDMSAEDVRWRNRTKLKRLTKTPMMMTTSHRR